MKPRRRSFDLAYAMLRKLRKISAELYSGGNITDHDMRVLWWLQLLLAKEIKRAERKSRRTKAILQSIDASAAPLEAEKAAERLEGYRHLAYLWRSFGDAIAFLFLDKYALKQTYYSLHSTNPKQTAGFLSDKAGFESEQAALTRYLMEGIPALLCDLTNTIRHGDICLMAGADPYLVEVKSSGGLDRRGRAQRDEIGKLQRFFETDEAENIRGAKRLQRTALEVEEVTHLDQFNNCFADALRQGTAWRNPERGLYYIATTESAEAIKTVLAALSLSRPIVFDLNKTKFLRIWQPYTPFTLSIRDREALFGFMWGSIYALVVYDLDALHHAVEGTDVEIDLHPEDAERVFTVRAKGRSDGVRVGAPMFYRIGFEFSSPAWLVEMMVTKLAGINDPTLDDAFEPFATVSKPVSC